MLHIYFIRQGLVLHLYLFATLNLIIGMISQLLWRNYWCDYAKLDFCNVYLTRRLFWLFLCIRSSIILSMFTLCYFDCCFFLRYVNNIFSSGITRFMFYTLCVISGSANGATEAAIKYLLLSGLASSLLLFISSLRYGETGTTNIYLWMSIGYSGTPILAGSLWVVLVVALILKVAGSCYNELLFNWPFSCLRNGMDFGELHACIT